MNRCCLLINSTLFASTIVMMRGIATQARQKVLFLSFIPALVLCHDLSLLTGDISSQFKSLYQSEHFLCSQNALKEYITECLIKGADHIGSKLRTQLAVMLSICEFEEAGVEYPEICQRLKGDVDFESCVKEFLVSPQLWTTYSGHYRRLRAVCYEEAVPFIRRNILDLFFNVTRIYTDFQLSAMKKSAKAEEIQEELLAKFQAVVDLMNRSYSNHEKAEVVKREKFNELQQYMVEKSKAVEDSWDNISREISINTERLRRDLSNTHQKLQLIFEYVDAQFTSVVDSNRNIAELHFQASQSISHDLMIILDNTKQGHIILQDLLRKNLQQSQEIDYQLQGTQLRVNNILQTVENDSRAIMANVTQELREEALSLFIVFRTTFESSFTQFKYLGQKVGQTVFEMNAVSLGLDSNLEILHDRIRDLKAFSVSELLRPLLMAAKVTFCLVFGILAFQFKPREIQGRGTFLSAIFFGAITTYLAKSVVF